MELKRLATRPRLLGCLLALTFVPGCGGGNDPFFQDVRLEVGGSIVMGQGSGRVIGDNALPFTFDCRIISPDSLCVRRFTDAGLGGAFTLTAVPDAGSIFLGWSSSCIADNPGTCQVECGVAGQDAVCSATFGQDAGDVIFLIRARFELADANAKVLQDDFDEPTLCGQWRSTVWSSSGAVSAFEDCVATGGDGDSRYRQMTHQITGAGSLVVFHRFEGANYSPATQGAIKEVQYSWLRRVVTPAFAGAAVGDALGALQDGQLYTVSLGAFNTTTWQSTSGTVTAADFQPAPGPDFSAAGAPIEFGYLRSNTNTNPAAVQTNVHGIDNWRVAIVPE